MKSKISYGNLFLKNRRGVSEMIGYVLLIGFAIAMSIGVYQLIKSYTPKSTLECPDGVSIFVMDYGCESNKLNLTLKNSGRFDIHGYFIHISNDSAASLATIDLSQKLLCCDKKLSNGIEFNPPLAPTERRIESFDTTGIGKVYSVEIIPIRYQEEKNKIKLVTCSNALSKNEIKC